MNREVFLRCPLFKDMSYYGMEQLFGCLRIKNNYIKSKSTVFVPKELVAIVADGEVITPENRIFGAGNVICPAGSTVTLRAAGDAEILTISKKLLGTPCKNHCPYHMTAIRNYIKILETNV